MKKLGLIVLFVAAACGGGDDTKKIVLPDVTNQTCDPLAQTGCPSGQKCTWIVDATPPQSPQYIGHVGCAPAGSKAVKETCAYGLPGDTGYDDCAAGLVCSSYKPKADGTWAPGFCKAICDHQGGNPMCDPDHVCVRYSQLFKPDSNSPAVAGVCDVRCDVFEDNDYDGSGASSTKVATTKCPDTADNHVGCYGYPSGGTPPATGWSCTNDVNYSKNQPTGFRHDQPCTQANGCGDAIAPSGYTNSCNSGYLPMFYESYAVQTVLCTAMCKPTNCYKGNCGAGNVNRVGIAPNACSDANRESLNGFVATDHCKYQWSLEYDRQTMTFLRSTTSDTVGFCFQHDNFVYDSNNDGQFNQDDQVLPNCADVELMGTGDPADLANPLVFWGASDIALGCVDSATAGVMWFQGKAQLSEKQREKLMRVQIPRGPYTREMLP